MQAERIEVQQLKLPVIWEFAHDSVRKRESVATLPNFWPFMGEMKTRYASKAIYVHGGEKIEHQERNVTVPGW
jgi:hypothetical protein